MARIRSIFPGLFTDEDFVQLSEAAQIFYIGLLTEADDQGVFEWKPVVLKMRLKAASMVPVEPLLAELVEHNRITSYTEDGRPYGAIRNFVRYQRPKKPNDHHPLPLTLRKYVGFESDGTRPAAPTGRKQFVTADTPNGSGSEPSNGKSHSVPNEFRTSRSSARPNSGTRRAEGGGRREEGCTEEPGQGEKGSPCEVGEHPTGTTVEGREYPGDVVPLAGRVSR